MGGGGGGREDGEGVGVGRSEEGEGVPGGVVDGVAVEVTIGGEVEVGTGCWVVKGSEEVCAEA